MSRPLKINEIVIQALEKAFSYGMTRNLACQHAGISISAYHTWMSRGKDEEDTIYGELYRRVKKAEANHALANLALIQKAAKEGSWTASAWILERKYGYQKQIDPLIEVNIDSRQISVSQLLTELEDTSKELENLISKPIIDLDEE
jgi:transposase